MSRTVINPNLLPRHRELINKLLPPAAKLVSIDYTELEARVLAMGADAIIDGNIYEFKLSKLSEDIRMKLKKGEKYNFKHQSERLVYLGHNWSGNGFWHQFALVDKPDEVWSEIRNSDLDLIEETK